MSKFTEKIAGLLNGFAPRNAVLENVLRETLRHFRSESGTIHLLDADKQLLHLAAQNKPVSICNLQTDSSGVAKSGAKQTGLGGSICAPIRTGDKLTGTFGIGTVRPYEYTADETRELEEIGRHIGESLKG